MSVREKGDMPFHRADSCDQPIDPRANLLRAFPTWTAVAEKHPSGRLRMDLFRASALRMRRSSIPSDRDRFQRASPRPANSQVFRARFSGLVRTSAKFSLANTGCQQFRHLSAVLRKRDVGGAGVLPAQTPFRLAVPDEINLLDRHIHLS